MRIDWKQYFMIEAKIASLRSGCNSRPTGAIIVKEKRIVATGYNASPSGCFQCTDNGPDFCYRRASKVSDDEKHSSCKSIHAEQNAIIQAATHGISIVGAEMYCTLAPCNICLKMIKQAKLKKVYYELIYQSPNKKRDDEWFELFKEYNLEHEQIEILPETIEQCIRTVKSITSSRRL